MVGALVSLEEAFPIMTVRELKEKLVQSPDQSVTFQLPEGSLVPAHFHITEVGFGKKTFIDCGGVVRVEGKCLVQVWVANDTEHRVDSSRLATILEHGKPVLPSDSLPVEIEYNNPGLTHMPLEKVEEREEGLFLMLVHKQTDCLAKDVCGITPENDCCTPASGCC